MTSDATLDQLEGPGWADPDYPSYMVQRIRALGRVPLRDFTPEDFRLIITQKRALGTLMPLALDLLEADPFTEGDLYRGDLLLAVARVPSDSYQARVELRTQLKRVVATAIARMGDLTEVDRKNLEPELRKTHDNL